MADGERRKTETEKRKSILFVDENRRKSTADSKKLRASRSTILENERASRMKMRRKSYGFRSVSGIRPVDRSSQVAIEMKRPPQIYLNTYQLTTYAPFNPVLVLKIANSVLDELFTEHKYNPQNSPMVTLQIAGTIMRRVKALEFNRYRCISVVTVGQKRAQSYNNAVSFLWDHERDGYIEVERELNTCFIQVTVFGVYFD